MKKFLTLVFIFTFLWVVGCKKSEKEQPSASSATPEATTTPEPAKPTAEKKASLPASPLEIYKEKTLVTSVPPEQFKEFFSTKVPVKDKKFNGILLRDILKKYDLKDEYVVLGGPGHSVSLTWAQANSDALYVLAYSSGILWLNTTSGDLPVDDFPKRLIKITVSASPAAKPSPKQPKKEGSH